MTSWLRRGSQLPRRCPFRPTASPSQIRSSERISPGTSKSGHTRAIHPTTEAECGERHVVQQFGRGGRFCHGRRYAGVVAGNSCKEITAPWAVRVAPGGIALSNFRMRTYQGFLRGLALSASVEVARTSTAPAATIAGAQALTAAASASVPLPRRGPRATLRQRPRPIPAPIPTAEPRSISLDRSPAP